MNDIQRSIKWCEGERDFRVKGCEKWRVMVTCIAALEKQIPKKPKEIDEDFNYFECASCGSAIYFSSDKEDHKFCLICGQKLDWEVDRDADV